MESNHGYFPLLVGDALPRGRDGLYEHLKSQGIFTRRYFFPLLSNLPMYRDTASADPANLPVANDAAARILCLPIYPDLADAQVERIVAAIRAA